MIALVKTKLKLCHFFNTVAVTRIGVFAGLICVTGLILNVQVPPKFTVSFVNVMGLTVVLTNNFFVSWIALMIGTSLSDFFVGQVVYIPVTLLIVSFMTVSVHCVLRLTRKYFVILLVLALVSCYIYLYLPFTWLIINKSAMLVEVMVDTIQIQVTIVTTWLIYALLHKINQNYALLYQPPLLFTRQKKVK